MLTEKQIRDHLEYVEIKEMGVVTDPANGRQLWNVVALINGRDVAYFIETQEDLERAHPFFLTFHVKNKVLRGEING